MDNGSETVQRVDEDTEYVDPVEANALVRAGLRRAWDSNPQALAGNGFQAMGTTPSLLLRAPDWIYLSRSTSIQSSEWACFILAAPITPYVADWQKIGNFQDRPRSSPLVVTHPNSITVRLRRALARRTSERRGDGYGRSRAGVGST